MKERICDSTVASVLQGQNLAVLATKGEGYPYTSLVGFAASPDFRTLVFATMRQTRKYANIRGNSKISMLIASSTNTADDFKDAASITVLGEAGDAEEGEREELERTYLAKFPYLEDFIKDPSCALVKVSVEKLIVVTRFQEVREIEVREDA